MKYLTLCNAWYVHFVLDRLADWKCMVVDWEPLAMYCIEYIYFIRGEGMVLNMYGVSGCIFMYPEGLVNHCF